MEILQTIGEKIKARRKAKGLSQEMLGELAGLSINYVGQIERGQRQVAIDTLSKIVNILETDLGVFFEDFKRAGNQSQTDLEISALTEAASRMSLEELKFMRKMAEKLAKRQ